MSICCLPNSDVRESLEQAHQLYAQWKLHLDGHTDLEKFQSATTDLRSCIKSIDWDLQDLEETISKLDHAGNRVSRGLI